MRTLVPMTAIVQHCALRRFGSALESRGNRFHCPFCDTLNLGISDIKQVWHCFSGSCPQPQGLVLDTPVAYGFAPNRPEAAKWLCEQGLIPPMNKPGRNTSIPYTSIPSPAPQPIKYQYLNALRLATWAEAQRNLHNTLDAVGIKRLKRESPVEFDFTRARKQQAAIAGEKANLSAVSAWIADGIELHVSALDDASEFVRTELQKRFPKSAEGYFSPRTTVVRDGHRANLIRHICSAFGVTQCTLKALGPKMFANIKAVLRFKICVKSFSELSTEQLIDYAMTLAAEKYAKTAGDR